MRNSVEGPVGLAEAPPSSMRLRVQDVTGLYSADVSDIASDMPAGAVARGLASRLSLPTHVPWGLRDDRSSRYLDDDVAIGSQIESGQEASVSLIPRSHLGGSQAV